MPLSRARAPQIRGDCGGGRYKGDVFIFEHGFSLSLKLMHQIQQVNTGLVVRHGLFSLRTHIQRQEPVFDRFCLGNE